MLGVLTKILVLSCVCVGKVRRAGICLAGAVGRDFGALYYAPASVACASDPCKAVEL